MEQIHPGIGLIVYLTSNHLNFRAGFIPLLRADSPPPQWNIVQRGVDQAEIFAVPLVYLTWIETKQALTQLASPIYFLEGDRGGQPRSKSSVATRSDLQPTPATMARRHLLLLVLPLLALAFSSAVAAPQGQGDAAAFIDGASHRYLRDQQDDQAMSMSLDEVSAAVSVLLGFAPSAMLPAPSSAKLNKLLLPKPFDRPRAVFLVQIDGSHDSVNSFISDAGSIYKTKIDGAKNAATELTDKDELIVIRSDESSGSDVLDNDLTNLATWLEGSYQKADGKLNIPLKSGNSLTLLLNKEVDVEFASSLISLLKTIKRGIQVHEDFSGGIVSPAELLVCQFTGIKALEDEYGSAEIVKQGAEVVKTALTKAFEQLQGAYNGKIVGLVISTKEASTSLASIIDGPSSLHISRRLAEASRTNATASIAAIYLVRLSLAWITGIIFLVSTLIGICLLMNMPLTRDTLLYSNVKMD